MTEVSVDAERSVVDRLLAARFQFGGTGNRRRLFGRFDEILSDSSDGLEDTPFRPELRIAERKVGFQFRGLFLRNWKAFEEAEITFPSTHPTRTVSLVGGNNGNGKTSILEALVYGLYGVRGLLDTVRGIRTDTAEAAGSKRAEYQRFIERALHRSALEHGDLAINVRITVDTADGLVEIDRRWYFDDDGRFAENDEELILRVGEDRHVLSVPDQQAAAEFYQGEIDRLVAPASLIPFFLFDGEHVRRLAERELDEQVRFGIESALGLTALRSLIDDLRDYIRDRDRDIQAEDAETSSVTALAKLELERETVEFEISGVQERLMPLRTQRDQMVREMGSLGVATYDDQKEGLEERRALEGKLKAARDELIVSTSHLPFAIVGERLMNKTLAELDRFQRATSRGAEAFGQAELDALLKAATELQPRLDKGVEKLMRDRIGHAWRTLERDKPQSGEAANIHKYLSGHRVDRVINLLREYSTDNLIKPAANFDTVTLVTKALEELGNLQDTRQRNAVTRQELGERLGLLNFEIAELEASRRTLDQNLGRILTNIEPLRMERQRRRAQRSDSDTLAVRVGAAQIVSDTVRLAVERIVPTYYGRLASRVTEVYRVLAHKGIVNEVLIGADGSVQLLDMAGRNLRDTDPSAGENQVFAMSLISAISDLLGAPLPLVIDTPLGRLDPGHRERILDHFAHRDVQTILLSQPEEVGGRYYDRIASRIAAEFYLSYQPSTDGLGRSVLSPGYFPRQAA